MQVTKLRGASRITEEIAYQLADIRRTWSRDPGARLLVWGAVAAGLGVVALAISVDILRYLDLHHYRARFLSLTTDRSLPEWVMDALLLFASALMAELFARTRRRSYAFLASLLVLIALDDFFSFHESIGRFLVTHLSIPDFGGLKGQVLGELVFLATFAFVCIPFLLWSVWGMQSANLAVLGIYGAILAGFAAFSGGVDVLHSLAQSTFMDRLMGWIEESGEILMVTILTSTSILQSRGRPAA